MTDRDLADVYAGDYDSQPFPGGIGWLLRQLRNPEAQPGPPYTHALGALEPVAIEFDAAPGLGGDSHWTAPVAGRYHVQSGRVPHLAADCDGDCRLAGVADD